MNHIYGYPHSKEAEFYKLLLDYDESLERDLADCRAIWYESGTQNLMVGDYGISDRIISMIISKNFGFIKRLVENDKIDKKKIDKTERRPMYVTDDMFSLYDLDECVIMLLSISSSPIDFLISILK